MSLWLIKGDENLLVDADIYVRYGRQTPDLKVGGYEVGNYRVRGIFR